jgi:hypothetical protein
MKLVAEANHRMEIRYSPPPADEALHWHFVAETIADPKMRREVTIGTWRCRDQLDTWQRLRFPPFYK